MPPGHGRGEGLCLEKRGRGISVTFFYTKRNECPPVVPPFQNQKWGEEGTCLPVVPPFQNQKWGDEVPWWGRRDLFLRNEGGTNALLWCPHFKIRNGGRR